MNEQQTLDPAAVQEVMGHLVADLAATAGLQAIHLGIRVGLWKAMAGRGGLIPAEVAAAAGVAEPYAREWLKHQAASGYVAYDPATERFELPAAVAARQANEAMISHAEGDQFVTGLLLRADLRSRRVVAVNAGHPHPYRVRGGRAECLELAADLPFGMIAGSTYREQDLLLEPGDRLVVVTDGFLERNAAAADFDVMAAVADTAALHPREVVQVFKAAVLAASGAELADDAAVLCIDWHGSPPTPCRAGGA